VDHPRLGAIRLPGHPVRFSRSAVAPGLPPPTLGEHTDEVLGTELGLDGAELEELRRAGVIA